MLAAVCVATCALNKPALATALSRRTAVSLVPALAAFARQPAWADGSTIETTMISGGDQSSPTPQRGQKVEVDYTLWLDGFDGKLIDTTRGSVNPFPKAPQPFAFVVGVGQVIPGWDITVRTMHVGEKRRVVIPSSLGYGAKGTGPIPGGANLYFEIELRELRKMAKLTDKQKQWIIDHPEP